MISWKPSERAGSAKRREKSPNAIPGRRVRDSGFYFFEDVLLDWF